MIRKVALVSGILVLSLLVALPAPTVSAKELKDPEPYVANFSYTPETLLKPGSGGVTFATANIVYQFPEKVFWPKFPQFAHLEKAIINDLTKILIAKGFSVRGPFDSYDLIPYSDKKVTDLYLTPTFEMLIVFKGDKTGAVCTGTVEVSGRLILEMKEMMTRELMWSKNIPLRKWEFPYNIKTPNVHPYDLKPFIMNDVAKGLEQEYPQLMSTMEGIVDPEEMRVLKKQAQELKRKKSY